MSYMGNYREGAQAEDCQMEVHAMSFVRACFCSFRWQMRGFNDLLREKPSSLFMLGWSSISVASLMIRSHASGFFDQNTGVL
jgi:hypothetical protein